jgi:YggT family protein
MDSDQQPSQQLNNQRPGVGAGQVARKVAQIVWLIVVLIVLILAIRVVFSLIGANTDNQFASIIYSISEPFIVPFRGLLQVGEYQLGVSRLEFETLVAMFVYLLAGWGITAVVKVLSR